MKKQFIFILFSLLVLFPSVNADSVTTSCGSTSTYQCQSGWLNAQLTLSDCTIEKCSTYYGQNCNCQLDNGNVVKVCTYTSDCPYNGVGEGCRTRAGGTVVKEWSEATRCSWTQCSTSSSRKATCTWDGCSGTSCHPSISGRRCSGGSPYAGYIDVSKTKESCNNKDDNCNGQIDEGLTQSCGNCGTRACVSGSFGSCTGQGVCSQGSTQSCGYCGTQSCTSSCQWNTCIEGACEIVFAYWADMNNNPTSKADNLDKVNLITLSEELLIGKTITIDIYKSNTLFGIGILDWLVPDNKVDTLTKTIDSKGTVIVEWTIPDVDVITYYYAYSHVVGYSEDYTSKATIHLEISPTENNAAPSAVITYPNYDSLSNYKFSAGQQIIFNQSSFDVDGTIESYSWDFNSGNPATSSSSAPVSVTYSTAGPKYISLTVVDDKGVSSTDTVGVLIDDISTNQPPLVAVTSPESGKTYSKKILCDATKTIDDNTPFEQLSFTWYFDSIPDPLHTNVNGTAGAYFEKIFDTAGAHSIAVTVDDGE